MFAASKDGNSSVGELPGSLYSTSRVFKTLFFNLKTYFLDEF